ncbi:LysM peptidoglycan-binding domain-containing protein [Mobiluncus curtisii]|uniref:LysM peptidoglycan-binding domain-containing protein n=1 Tax=Mobiluncus curtisii TaxID=2051 RepID=UPI00201615C0|nr:LysM peptidoglycan-binding domain-containing protein [Mobiluncus curtisii]
MNGGTTMTAVLAPSFSDFELCELAPNHPAVRASRGWQSRPAYLHLVSKARESSVASAQSVLSWDAAALRVALFILAALVMVFLGMVLGLGLSPDFVPTDFTLHTVVPGDTMWDIAAANATGVPADEVLADMMDANALDASSVLNAGQTLLVPVY